MKVTPLKERILVKPIEAEEKTKAGIIIPDTAKESTYRGKVIAVGEGKEMPAVKPGDTVIYEKFGGTEIKIDGEKHLILQAKDVLAKID